MIRPVSGLLIIALATPSHIFTIVIINVVIQYSGFVAAHSYRCGGSTGVSPVSRFTFTSCILPINIIWLEQPLKTPNSAAMLRYTS